MARLRTLHKRKKRKLGNRSFNKRFSKKFLNRFKKRILKSERENFNRYYFGDTVSPLATIQTTEYKLFS